MVVEHSMYFDLKKKLPFVLVADGVQFVIQAPFSGEVPFGMSL